MGVIDNIFSRLGYNKATPLPPKADIRQRIDQKTQIYRVSTDIQRYRNAVTSAESINNPQRYELYQVYNQVVIDAHVTSVIQQRKALTLSKEFCVYGPDGEEDEEKTKLIRTKWFYEFLEHSLDSKFWGHSLLQFESIITVNNIDQFKCVDLVPRLYVKPEFHIVTSDYSAIEGTNYLDPPFNVWCLEVGQPRDLGLLMKIAPLQIWKKNALGAWAEYVEKFGTPIRILYSDSNDLGTQAKEDAMMQQMGTSFYAILGTDQKFDLREFRGQDAFQVFDEMINRCNSEISKLVLNQTGTTDEKAFVGSAEVHERVLDTLAWSDEKFITNVLNYQLIPLMNAHGFGLDGCTIKVESEEEFSIEERAKFDIELLKTGKFTFDPEYIKENYGSEVIPVEEPKDDASDVAKRIKNYYS